MGKIRHKIEVKLIYSLLFDENKRNNHISDNIFALFKITAKI